MMRTKVNPHQPPNVPGNTEWERFDNAVRKTLTVSQAEFRAGRREPMLAGGFRVA
jgi:hypothetical protein